MARHDLDDDAVCLHCGLDAAEYTKGEKLPPCPVEDEDTRRRNVEEYNASSERNYRL